MTTPRTLPFQGWTPSTVYAGGAFYVLASADIEPPPIAPTPLRMVRIETDGTVGAAATVVDVLPGSFADYGAILVPGAGDLRIVYRVELQGGAPDSKGFMFQKISTSGAAVGDRVLLATLANELHPPYVAVAGAVALDGGTFAMFTNAGHDRLDAVTVGADGQIATPLFKVMSSGDVRLPPMGQQVIARVGTEVVALWYTSRGVRLARITP